MKYPAKQIRKVLCIAVLGLLLTGTSFATKIHKIYEDPAASFAQRQLNKQVMVGPTGTDSIYVMLDNGDGILLMRTDMDGNPVWTHLYGNSRDYASTLGKAADGNIIMVSYALSNIDAVATKIDAISGAVIWSYRYPGLNEASTITKRGSRHVLTGDTAYSTPANDYLAKPMAVAINDADGSVVWAKKYFEGQADYLDSYNHYITGYAVNPNQIIYVGKYYDSVVDPHGEGHRRVSQLTINVWTGNPVINAMHTYDLELGANDYAIESDAPFPWDIARVKDPVSGTFEGFAIAGSYSHSDTYTYTATDPVVLRVDQAGNPLWAKLYDSPNSAYGFARGIRQNVYFLGGRLDVYTSWENYQNAIDGSNTVSGLLRINEADGLPHGITIYDVPNDDFAGMSMNEDGSGGYLAIGTRDTAPFDTFQLLKVGQIGGNVDCLVEHEIEAEDLMVDDIIVEIVPEDVEVNPAVYDLPYVDLPLNVFECDGSL